MDFEKHNKEVKEVWDAYNNGKPIRVPMILGMALRMIFLNKKLNSKGITYKEYFENPDVMWDANLEFAYWSRFNMIRDEKMGLPEDGWAMNVNFINCYEAAWFGCEVHYYENQIPDTAPILTNDKKNMLFDKGIPDPFKDGIMKKNMEYYLYFKEKAKNFTFHNLPIINVTPSGLGTDGAFTTAANLRGATELCLDIYEDPEYVKKLLAYIVEATIVRIKAWRKFLDYELKPKSKGFADDSIQLISTDVYKEFVLPAHKHFLSGFAGEGPHSIHLCGDATRHFKIIRDELNVKNFDTGFPVDFGNLRKILGPDVTINGGPNIRLLLTGSVKEIEEETKRILQSGVMEGGKFILREGNNLAPCTPPENIEAMYRTVQQYGVYN